MKNLIELGFIFKNSEGIYTVKEWAETNPWAADAINREDKARLSGMARFYPELYEELTANGATGISKSEYARITAEYNSRGIVYSQGEKCEKCDANANAFALKPKPVPAPVPNPESIPSPEAENPVVATSTASSSSSSVSQKKSKKTKKQNPSEPEQQLIQFEDSTKIEKLSGQGEFSSDAQPENTEHEDIQSENQETTTVEKVLSQWNNQLGALGF